MLFDCVMYFVVLAMSMSRGLALFVKIDLLCA